ncbi:MAG TPA: hypothetical protein VH475_04955 [Tepidisphaeraceae bacterium]|jgi:hypothetical protein
MGTRSVFNAAIAAVTALASLATFAAPFTPGDLAVLRYGDGAETLGSGNAVSMHVDEYTTAGTFVQSIDLPTSGTGAATALPGGGREGIVQLAQDRRSIVVGGYRAATGTPTTLADKVIAVVRADGSADTATSYNNVQVGNPIRSVATRDATSFYTASDGSNSLAYVPYGAGATAVAIQSGSWRAAHVANDQLYVVSGSSNFRGISTVGTGLPTSAGQSFATITPAPNPATGPGVSSMVIASDNPNLIYAAGSALVALDSGTGAGGDDFRRYRFDGTSWVLNGSSAGGIGSPAGSSSAYGVFTIPDGTGGEVVYLTTSKGIYKVNDANPFGTDFSGLSLVKLVDAPANTEFRGLAGVPVTVPEPASLGIIAVWLPTLLKRQCRK